MASQEKLKAFAPTARKRLDLGLDLDLDLDLGVDLDPDKKMCKTSRCSCLLDQNVEKALCLFTCCFESNFVA